MNESLIIMDKISKSYKSGDEQLVLFENLSCNIEQGESVVLTGESGTGKSTLLNLVGGLDSIDSGSLDCCGYAVSSLPEKGLTTFRQQKLGFVFQFHFLLKDFTALENLKLPAKIAGKKESEINSHSKDLLEIIGLTGRAHHYPSQLSGGERQRIAIARALMNNPDLILADEPTGNLDEKNSRIIEDILFSLTVQFGTTLLLVTHDEHLANRGGRHLHLTGGELKEL